MNRHAQQLWMTLVQAGVVQGDAPQTEHMESPWYVKVLLAFSGWIAAIFFLCFLAMAYTALIHNSAIAGLTGGAILVVASILLRTPRNEFIEHLALALSLAGQALVVYWIFDHSPVVDALNWLWVMLFQAVLVVLMPNFIHRVFSSLVLSLAFFMAMLLSGWSVVVGGTLLGGAAWCWCNELRFPSRMRLVQAAGYGLVLALLFFHGTELSGNRFLFLFSSSRMEQWGQPWMGELIKGVVMLSVVWAILRSYQQPAVHPLALMTLLATAVVCGLSLEVYGLTTGVTLIVLGFAASHRVLLGLGIASLLLFLSSYYSLLDLTLLAKSGRLCATGLALLLLRWCMLRVLFSLKEGKHV
ncbi:DUF4401 domain-containing protein [uncultured Vibrio sp.]|uniref:DUF4401 domain-containing protein n=1 Tax=uncultured Vibrio sp. TaxID=114054 RepID=UPI002AA630D4|nr:DUF4401 domain-containing protein [uncultured Vibrio sp.]